jgi:serine/threonine-protein kinase RsbW
VADSGEHAGASEPRDAQHHDRRTVLVQVKASASDLPPLRVVAADLAARAEFDLDTVADLRLAVDEAASELVAVAAPEALLTCVFSLDAAQMEVTASVPACPGATLRQDSFGWRVLTTLVDEVRAGGEPDGDPPVLGISLCKRRPVSTLAQHR